MTETIQFTLNGKPMKLTVDSDRMLLWVLRTDLELTGTKYGCGESLCGACTVVVDNIAVRSCQTPVKHIQGREVVTIEGLAKDGQLHPVQKAFKEAFASIKPQDCVVVGMFPRFTDEVKENCDRVRRILGANS